MPPRFLLRGVKKNYFFFFAAAFLAAGFFAVVFFFAAAFFAAGFFAVVFFFAVAMAPSLMVKILGTSHNPSVYENLDLRQYILWYKMIILQYTVCQAFID